MSISAAFRKGAETMLRIGGSDGTLIKTTYGAFDPSTGQAAETVTTFPVKASNPSHVERWENGGLVRQGEDSLIIGAKGLAVAPEIGDRVKINGVEWTLINVKEIQAQNIPVIYVCLVKK